MEIQELKGESAVQQGTNGPLFKRIAAVMAAVRSLPKDGYNSQNNYNYVSSDTVLDRIGKAMADHGLVIIPMLTDYETVDEQKGNSVRTRTRARFQMHICDVEGNAFLCPWAAEGVDYGNPERALNKAMTNAIKYFLLKLFVVGAGGEDADEEGAHTAQAARKPARMQPPEASRKPVAAKAEMPPNGEPVMKGKTEPPAVQEPPRASEAQVKELVSVGRQAYGEGWDEKRRQLVLMMSRGTSEAPGDLSSKEADDLIAGIKKKLAEGATQPQAASRQAVRFTTH